jgi:hypothetical protein
MNAEELLNDVAAVSDTAAGRHPGDQLEATMIVAGVERPHFSLRVRGATRSNFSGC